MPPQGGAQHSNAEPGTRENEEEGERIGIEHRWARCSHESTGCPYPTFRDLARALGGNLHAGRDIANEIFCVAGDW